MKGEKRVVITGMGAVTPFGEGVDLFWEELTAGNSAIKPITLFDCSAYETRIAGEVYGFDPEKWIDRKEVKKADRFVQFAVAASRMAVDDAALTIDAELGERMGVIIGAGLGGLPTIEEFHTTLMTKGPKRVSPFYIPKLIANMAPGYVSMQLGLKGPNECVVTACASANHSIGTAFRIVQRGEAPAMLCGGSEAVITGMGVSGFNALQALSTRNDEPDAAPRAPSTRTATASSWARGRGSWSSRNSSTPGARGARIYAEMVGYGATADAYHITAPDPEGDGAMRCMRMAIADAGLHPGRHRLHQRPRHLHPVQRRDGDAGHQEGLRRARPDASPVSSTKSMIGHLLGAAGGVEAIACVKTIETGIIPPTINYDTPDPECDLDYVPNTARRQEVVHGPLLQFLRLRRAPTPSSSSEVTPA